MRLFLAIVFAVLLAGVVSAKNPEKCPDGIWDEAEQSDPGLCPEDRPKNASSPAQQPPSPGQPPSSRPQPRQSFVHPDAFSLKTTGAKYNAVTEKPEGGWFQTGQEADIMLSGIGFNDSGGGLLFNHPAGLACDGTHLLLSDRNNNRILIWNKLPTGNTPPDLVLGQPNFTGNNPGRGMNQLDWPSAVASAKGKVVVADSYNNRFLFWLFFPTRNAHPADFAINTQSLGQEMGLGNLEWPWGAWTDGQKLVLTAVHGSVMLIWNSFPTAATQKPDRVIKNAAFGTPRYITSDGTRILVWDHNAKVPTGRDLQQQGGSATFVWKSWPTVNDQPYDFYFPGQAVGSFTPKGELILTGVEGVGLKIWKTFPAAANTPADLSVTAIPGGPDDGSGGGAGEILYILRGNENKVFGYLKTPIQANQKPDFLIGSTANFFITNPVPASNGKQLFVSSDFDRKLYVWKSLPDQSGAYPDLVYTLPFPPWQNVLRGNTLILGGQDTIYVWKRPPLAGEKPDIIFTKKIGSVSLQNIRGIALDDKYFYLADDPPGKVYVWPGIPEPAANPVYTLDTGISTGQIYSNGEYLLVRLGQDGGSIKIFRVAGLGKGETPREIRSGQNFRFNLPAGGLVMGQRLLVADTGFNRILGWNTIDDAMAGRPPTLILGDTDLNDITPEIGRNKLFWPAAMSFDGSFLWVGEFKFSGRLLRFSVRK